jgi:uncharacterized protein YigE (DUF2233 family)
VIGRLLGAALCLWAGAAAAADPCRAIRFEGAGYVVCEAAAGADLRLFLHGPDGSNLGGFAAVGEMLAAEGRRLAFAMNGGMYHPDRSPVGLLVVEGAELAPLVEGPGPGNFGMEPNGVFCVREEGYAVLTTPRYAALRPACRHATQSGPMLVVEGALHPRFIEGSDSRYIRNGVGVSPDGGTAWLAISDAPVSFHRFARLFRDGLGASDALYLDGKVSRLHAPALGRRDLGWPLGPILGLAASD